MPLNVSQGSEDFPSMRNSKSGKKLTIDFETLQQLCLAGIEWSTHTLRNRVRLDTLRPFPMFMGINTTTSTSSPMWYLSADAFGPPVKHLDKSTLEKVKSRLSLNFAFFLTNYVLATLIVALVVALLHPSMLLFVGLLYGLWAGHTAWGDHDLQLFGVELQPYLSKPTRVRVLSVITTLVLIWKCLRPVITSALLSAVMILMHAFLRDPKHIELADTATATTDNGGSDEDAEGGGLLLYKGEMTESAVLVERPGSKPSTSTNRSSGGGGDVI